MVYYTGDMHGDARRFSGRELRWLKKKDTLIVCGDFGFIWQGGEAEAAVLKKIGKRRHLTLFIEGTHDNVELIAKYPVEELLGGRAHHICGNLWHLMRGEIYEIDGKTLLAMGGGESRDFALREIGVNWWPEEMPSEAEVAHCLENLKAHDNSVDYIVTHQAPTNIDACVTNKTCDVTCLTALMDTLQKTCKFSAWYFGFYHQNRFIPPYYYAVYDKKIAGV